MGGEAQDTRPAVWTVLDPEKIESARVLPSPNNPITRFSPRAVTHRRTPIPSPPVFASRVRPRSGSNFCRTTDCPMRGPGRNANGNLHLTEFQVRSGSNSVPMSIRQASSDYDQPGWGIAAAIDGNDQTAWGIYPEVGKPHQAVFELREDVRRRHDADVCLAPDEPCRASDRPASALGHVVAPAGRRVERPGRDCRDSRRARWTAVDRSETRTGRLLPRQVSRIRARRAAAEAVRLRGRKRFRPRRQPQAARQTEAGARAPPGRHPRAGTGGIGRFA